MCGASREVLDYPSLLSDKFKQPYKPKLLDNKTYKRQFSMFKENLYHFHFLRKFIFTTYLSFEQYSETFCVNYFEIKNQSRIKKYKRIIAIYLSKDKWLFLNNNILLIIPKYHSQQTLNEFGLH